MMDMPMEVTPHSKTRCGVTGEPMVWCPIHIKWEHHTDHKPCSVHDVEQP